MRSLVRPTVLMILVLSTACRFAAADEKPKPRFPALDSAKAWERLPQKNPGLPVWARILSRSLPRTTAAMLRLDYQHRAKNPLGPVLRGKLRWVAAKANGCRYAVQYAEADLRRAGVKTADLQKLSGDHKRLPEKERLALVFAHKMSVAAHTVSDDEVADLLRVFGPKKLVAMVHTLAYANFQDRILLALDVEVEKGGPLPPLEIQFDRQRLAKIKHPKRPPWKEIDGGKGAVIRSRPEWVARSFSELQKSLAGQKARKSRIPLPPSAKPKKTSPKSKRPSRPRIVWSVVSMGYAPELTRAWFNCMGTFQREASLDRVFSNSLFWVVTRSNECFY